VKALLASPRRGVRTPDGNELLGHLQVCNMRIPVVRATVQSAPSLRDDDGSVLFGRFLEDVGLIVIRRGLSADVEKDTIVHEAMHAILRYSGATQLLTGAIRKVRDGEEAEELLIRVLAPHVAALRWVK